MFQSRHLLSATCALLAVCLVFILCSSPATATKCGDGQRAVQSELEITANGCGVPGLHVQMDGSECFDGRGGCCDLHDACYGICGIDRSVCEKNFEKCMDKACGKCGSKSMQCKSAAQTFAMGTNAMGSGAFAKSQEAACQCVDSDDEQLIANAYIPHAERVYRKALGEIDAEDKIDNFRERVLPKHFSKKDEAQVLLNLYTRYPATIEFVSDDKKKGGGDGGGDL